MMSTTTAVLFELLLCGVKSVSAGFGDENLDELGLVAAHRVDVVGGAMDVGDSHVDSEAATDRPLRFG